MCGRDRRGQVDLVGHSEGGLVSRTYVKYEGGAAEADSLITLGTPNYGTAAANLIRFFTLGTASASPPAGR